VRAGPLPASRNQAKTVAGEQLVDVPADTSFVVWPYWTSLARHKAAHAAVPRGAGQHAAGVSDASRREERGTAADAAAAKPTLILAGAGST
jgi:hypothetical protein